MYQMYWDNITGGLQQCGHLLLSKELLKSQLLFAKNV